MSKNPYLEQTNYFEGYKEGFEALLNSSERLELDRLVWTVFASPDGERLIEEMKNRFIYPATPSQLSASYSNACIYWEGYRAAFRYLISLRDSYQKRKDAEAKKA